MRRKSSLLTAAVAAFSLNCGELDVRGEERSGAYSCEAEQHEDDIEAIIDAVLAEVRAACSSDPCMAFFCLDEDGEPARFLGAVGDLGEACSDDDSAQEAFREVLDHAIRVGSDICAGGRNNVLEIDAGRLAPDPDTGELRCPPACVVDVSR